MANLGAELARRGYRVLLIDLDLQASLTFSSYRPKEWLDGLADEKTIMRWFGEFVAGQGGTVLTDLDRARNSRPKGKAAYQRISM